MAATYMTSNDLRLSLTFKIVTLKIRVTDLLSAIYNTTYGQTVSNLKGILNVTGSVSGVVYQNTYWSTAAFTSPDIIGNTATWYKEFDLPTDADGLIIDQEFTVEYLLSNTVTTYTTEKSYTYGYTSPTVTAELSHVCRTALLTSTDATGTDYLYGTIVPTLVRTHTVLEPAGTTRTPAGSTTTSTITDSRVLGGTTSPTTSLWSGTWQTYISTVLSYDVEVWGLYTWIVIEDTVTGYARRDVQCTDCACILNQCIANFFDYTLGVRNTDPGKYAGLREKSIEVLMRWMQFESAERCGEEYDTFCTDIQDIIKGTDCFCLQDATTSPVPIYPISGSTVTSVGASFLFALISSLPSSTPTWDWAILWDGLTVPSASTYYKLYQNTGGTAFYVGDLKGTAGAAGAAGKDGVGANQSILWNDIGNAGTAAGTSETTLKTYTLPSNILTANGEALEVDAIATFALNDNGKTVRLYWGGNNIMQYFTDSLIISGDDKLYLSASINRTSSTGQYVTAKSERGNKLYSPKETEWTEDLTNPVIVHITGQNSVATANDIKVKQFRIKYCGLVAGVPTFLLDYKHDVETLLAGVQKDVIFATDFASVPYTLNLTAWDINGDSQQVTVIGTPSISGFSVSTVVDTTLNWSAFL